MTLCVQCFQGKGAIVTFTLEMVETQERLKKHPLNLSYSVNHFVLYCPCSTDHSIKEESGSDGTPPDLPASPTAPDPQSNIFSSEESSLASS